MDKEMMLNYMNKLVHEFIEGQEGCPRAVTVNDMKAYLIGVGCSSAESSYIIDQAVQNGFITITH